MVSSPVQNISDFLKNRPPMVLFLICLVVLAVSTFYFAFEIEKDEPTVNSDKEHDWVQVLKHFNKLDICIGSSPLSWKDITDEEEDVKNTGLLYTQVTIPNYSMFNSYSEIQGTLSLEEWLPTACQNKSSHPKHVTILFDIPSYTSNTNNLVDVCVTLQGPLEFLPRLKNRLCMPTKRNDTTRQSKGFLSTKLPRIYDSTFCESGQLTKLLFDVTHVEIENYLNDDVRIQIYVHLMWFSYFLVFMIFGILLYYLFKKSAYLEAKEQSVRLL